MEKTKQCQNCKTDFTIESTDFEFYKKIDVPEPTFCPDCREQRRIAFRNERALYKRKCDLCGEVVVSRVSPDKLYPMYCKKCWWSDKWDPMDYGREYDFNKPFFEQFKDLLFSSPHISLLSSNTVNSDWVNQETDDKNCYLNVGGLGNEDSAYNTYELHGKDCFDNYWLFKSELCYENIHCERCYQTLFSQYCFDCRDTILSQDCRNCSNVFGCAGLRHKKYHIFNKPYSKEEYDKFLKDNFLGSYKDLLFLKEKAERVWLSVPYKDRMIIKSTNSSGNLITQSKNAKNCWTGDNVEDSKNLYITAFVKDSYDLSAVGYGELTYEGTSSTGLYNSKFFAFSLGVGGARSCSDLEYCHTANNSSDCFGCVNLRKKQYCILNKQYTKESFDKLRIKIIKHMNEMPYIDKKGRIYKYGEFFPIELSPYGYNETVAQVHFPLDKNQALANGYSWSDYESESKHKFSDYEIPDNINDVKDDILKKVLKCEISGKAYQIIPMELKFYRRIGLPIPRLSPLQRYRDRMNRLLPRKIFNRHCQCAGSISDNKIYKNTIAHFHKDKHCPNEFETSYAPDRKEIVYCEECYLKEIG